MSSAQIYPALSRVMHDVGAVAKTQKNQTQGFAYRGIDDVMTALSPALQKNRVFIVPEVLDCSREERTSARGSALVHVILKVRYSFFAEDGSSIQATVIGEGMDSGDKAVNKALSVAFKYACFQVLCIPTQELVDPDSQSHELAPRQSEKGASSPRIDQAKIAAIRSELRRTGIPQEQVLMTAQIESLEQMNADIYPKIMKKFSATPSRADALRGDAQGKGTSTQTMEEAHHEGDGVLGDL